MLFRSLAHAFILIALLLTPLDPAGLADDLFNNPNRFAKLILTEADKPPPPKKRFELSGSKGGAKHKEKEGQFGKVKEEKKDALASTKGAPKVDPNKREKDRKIALEAGILAALSGDKLSAVSDQFGPGGMGTGINNALGGLRGVAMGDAGGFLFQNYYMYLQSDEHPSIHLLVCGVYGDPFERGPISSEEMRIAMGDVLIIDGLP